MMFLLEKKGDISFSGNTGCLFHLLLHFLALVSGLELCLGFQDTKCNP